MSTRKTKKLQEKNTCARRSQHRTVLRTAACEQLFGFYWMEAAICSRFIIGLPNQQLIISSQTTSSVVLLVFLDFVGYLIPNNSSGRHIYLLTLQCLYDFAGRLPSRAGFFPRFSQLDAIFDYLNPNIFFRRDIFHTILR